MHVLTMAPAPLSPQVQRSLLAPSLWASWGLKSKRAAESQHGGKSAVVSAGGGGTGGGSQGGSGAVSGAATARGRCIGRVDSSASKGMPAELVGALTDDRPGKALERCRRGYEEPLHRLPQV